MNPRARHLGLAAVTAVVLAGAPAYAATAKPVCNQIVDGAGDAVAAPGAPNTASLDILSGDIATGAKNLVVVLRFAGMAADPLTTPGASYGVSWTVGGKPQSVSLTRYQDGSTKAEYQPDGTFGATATPIPIGALVDTTAATITWQVPRRLVPQLKKKGAKFSQLTASARPAVNITGPTGTASGTFLNGDTADSPRSYSDGARTCVKGV
ncbi:MAG TPA: hypothetical protein VFQ85_06545 [Mycobacteriales bacterium]|jgi:hypothetical protein|nr:hypothetical protein [Mycobacteriales bacterium]